MNEMTRIELDVRGMTCDSCAVHVVQALESIKGVKDADVPGWQSARATVVAESSVKAEVITAAVRKAGYTATIKTRKPLGGLASKEGKGNDYDLVVIGSGAAGFAGAIRAAELGYRVIMVEQGTIGGTCVNVGCVPSKTLIRTAEAHHRATHSPFAGVRPRGADLDWEAVMAEKDALLESLRQSKYVDVLKAYPDITFVQGKARLTPEANVEVDGRLFRPARVLITTGASPHVLPIPGIEKVKVLTSTEALALRERPESLLVIGGRSVALELAQIYARFGTRVTLLQRSPRIIPEHEPEIAEALAGYLREEGVTIHTGVVVQAIRQEDNEKVVTATVDGEEGVFRAVQVLMATGRRPNTADWGLEQIGLELDGRGAIVVDGQMRTSHPDIYASGDCTTNPMFVYVAAAGGAIAADNALNGAGRTLDLSAMPAVIFTDPQVAMVGLTEAQAKAQGYDVQTSTLPLEYVPRALAARDTRGLIKLVADGATGRLLGAHILAAEGGEVVQAAVLAVKFGLTLDDLTGTLFPYLTQVEGLKLAAQTFSKDVTKLSCCAG
ncbi:MAG: mercury(II) reductase [Anaerolineae bacterium]